MAGWVAVVVVVVVVVVGEVDGERAEGRRVTAVQVARSFCLEGALYPAPGSHILLGKPRLKGMIYSQNNPHLNSVNQGSLESFAGKAYVLEFFSTTHPLALLSRSKDPVHFHQNLYGQHAIYFMHFLSLICRAERDMQGLSL